MPARKISADHTSGAYKDPTTKANLVDKIMSYDFSGDLRDLAFNRDLHMKRTRPNVVTLEFGTSGQSFELVVRKPRGPKTVEVKAGANKRIGRTQTIKAAVNQSNEAHEPGEEDEREEVAEKKPNRRRRQATGPQSMASH